MRDRHDLTAPERDEIEGTLLREVLSAWGTGDVRETRPTPLDEVRSGLIVFEESLWTAVPRYLRGVDHALRAATGRGLPIEIAGSAVIASVPNCRLVYSTHPSLFANNPRKSLLTTGH